MIDLRGEGLLALWNGIDQERRAEYDLWHTREHVPERIGVPGMVGARRYVRTAGPLPEYLTLYAMDDTGVLASEPYLKLLADPTPWSRSMRPSFRGFLRLCCRREWSAGGGLGSALAAAVFEANGAEASPSFRDGLAGLLSQQGVVAAHLALRDPGVPDVPFAIGGGAPDFGRDGVLLVEGWDDDALARCLPAVRTALEPLAGSAATLTRYRLAYAVERESLGRLAAPRGMPLAPGEVS